MTAPRIRVARDILALFVDLHGRQSDLDLGCIAHAAALLLDDEICHQEDMRARLRAQETVER